MFTKQLNEQLITRFHENYFLVHMSLESSVSPMGNHKQPNQQMIFALRHLLRAPIPKGHVKNQSEYYPNEHNLC